MKLAIHNRTSKLGAWALCMVMLMGVTVTTATGCNGSDVAQQIVNFTPALQSAVATVGSTAALLAPADAPVFAAATAGIEGAITILDAQAKAYLANPKAGVLAQLQTAVVTAQQTINTALLNAAKITNPASQQHALAAINGVATIVTTILGLVESISSKSSVTTMAAASPVKVSQVRYLMDQQRLEQMAEDYGTTSDAEFQTLAQAGL